MNEIQDFFNGKEDGNLSEQQLAGSYNTKKIGTAKVQSPLVSLQKDLEYYKESIKEVALEILDQEYSEYPIFIAHQHTVALGEVILDREELGTSWTIQVSTLEEFVEHNIIKEDKKEKFKQNYKDPKTYMCLFVIVPEGANFVFSPYVNEDKNK